MKKKVIKWGTKSIELQGEDNFKTKSKKRQNKFIWDSIGCSYQSVPGCDIINKIAGTFVENYPLT